MNAVKPVARDPRYQLKLRAEKDTALSDGAARSLNLIVSHHCRKEMLPDAEFRLAWSDLSERHGGKRLAGKMVGGLPCRTAQRRIAEIVARGYMKPESLKGCPASWWYQFVFTYAKNGATTCASNRATGSTTNGATGYAKNGTRHISNSLLEKNCKKKSVGAAASANAAAPPQMEKQRMTTEQMKQLWESAKADAEKMKGIS